MTNTLKILRAALDALERVNTVDDCNILASSLSDAVADSVTDIRTLIATIEARPVQEPLSGRPYQTAAISKNLWAPKTKPARGAEWIMWNHVRATRQESQLSYLKNFELRHHVDAMNRVTFVRVSVVEQTALEVARDALEAECGGRCNAEYNPCHAREALTLCKP